MTEKENRMRQLITAFIALFSLTSLYADNFTLYSSAFDDRDRLDPVYTCEGKNISPDLAWSHVPKKTVSFVLILSDPDAPNGTFYHWVLFNIPHTVKSLPENVNILPAGTLSGKNSWGNSQYSGPCPPYGNEHRYIFNLYALDTLLDNPADANVESIQAAMQNHVLGVAELKSVFRR